MNKRSRGELNLAVAIAIIVSILVIFLATCLVIKNRSDRINSDINVSGDNKFEEEINSGDEEEQGTFAKPSIIGEYTYTGRPQNVKIDGYNKKAMSASSETRKDAGIQEIVISLKDTSKSEWEDKTTEPVKLEWTIKKAPITIKWANLEIRYDGEAHAPIASAEGLFTDKLTVKVSGAASSEGEHTATAELEGSAANNYEITNPTIQYNIIKASGDIGSIDESITLSKYSFVYSGYENEPTVRIKVGKETLEEGKDYTIRYEDNVNVGTARVIIVGKSKKYSGRVVKEFTITRNPKAEVSAEDKIYKGSIQNGVVGKFVEMSGTASAKDVGTYKVVAVPVAGYAWRDGTYDKVELTWNIKDGLKVGDYVAYTPTGKLSAELTTDDKSWRILSIDGDNILITTYGATNQNDVMLEGADGYLNVLTKLNKLCEDAYSNSTKGLKARSLTIEDLNKACGYTIPRPTIRYAYYTSSDSGVLSANSSNYTKVKHSSTLYGISEPRFYSYDQGTVIKTSATPKKLVGTDPVLLTQTYYTYNPSNGSFVKTPTAGEILGSGNGWIASQCTRLDTTVANFCIYYASSSEVASTYLCSSNGYTYSPKMGLHPVVSIASSKLDVENVNSNGTAISPWGIK